MPLEDELQALIEKRREIDRALLERHARESAVLFTDIVGSTAIFEQRGDIEGLALVHRHNELLFPVVAGHSGRVVKTIGDSIMAVFPTAPDAVACAVAMQEKLAVEPGTAAVERIRIRIGMHWGRVLNDGEDVFGDTVNTAARVASAAEGDEVLVSQALVDTLPKGHGWLTTSRRALAAKGKAAPVPVVAVAWRVQDREDAHAHAAASLPTLALHVSRGADGLRVGVIDPDDASAVKGYADVPISGDDIAALAAPFAVLAHDGGQAAYVSALADKGRELFARALPEPTQRRLRDALAQNAHRALRLELDDTLVDVPWELAHDGTDFLGLRFAVGRTVVARADGASRPESAADAIVVVANSSGDLPDAEHEGRVVAGLLSSTLGAAAHRVVHKSGPLTKRELLELVARARVLHFAGHVKKDAGLVVADGVVGAADLAPVLAKSAPALVFANGCHASSTSGTSGPNARPTGAPEPWRDVGAASLAQVLLLSGVQHTIAPLWGVPDADALAFALRFYEHALSGLALGECTRRARKSLSLSHRGPLSFAGYVLYGEPRAHFPLEHALLPGAGRTRSGDMPPANVPVPVPVPVPDPHAPPTTTTTTTTTTRTPALTYAAVGGLLTGVAVVAALVMARDPAPPAPPEAPTVAPPAPRVESAPRAGPVRISVMPFKGSDATLAYLNDGLAEVVVTELGAMRARGVELVERGQIDVDIGELDFQQSKYVDPATRAQLGKIAGAELVVLGAYQATPDALRFTARFVDVATGEVLDTAKVDGPRAHVFALQDRLAVEVRAALARVTAKVRP